MQYKSLHRLLLRLFALWPLLEPDASPRKFIPLMLLFGEIFR